MNKSKVNDPAKIAADALAFREQFTTLQLATCTSDGIPLASYAPYVLDQQQRFAILTSRLARHTANLLNQHRAAVLFIENEDDANNAFARRRLSFLCEVEHHSRESEFFSWQIAQMQEKFGPLATQLAELPDFEPFLLKPLQAEYVAGFGSAWRFSDGQLNQASLIRPER